MNVFRFDKHYFVATVILFLLEVVIAIFVHDRFIRPYFGDFLVVILLYCFLKSFLHLSIWTAAFIVMVFSFGVECSQYLNLVKQLGLQDSGIAKAVLGNSFSLVDLIIYLIGILFVVFVEKVFIRTED